MNPILYALFHLLKVLVKVSLRAFYPRTTILHQERLKFRGPVILISNHPNTLLDPLHVVARASRPVFFLANASLFRGWFQNWFFSTLYCIPVERPKDVGGRRVSNDDNFARCYEHLERGGNIWIAPEGGSEMERRVRPFRTGTARIAFGAEKRNGYGLGLRIIPVGLSYEAPNRFNSRVVLQAGEPVAVADFRELYETQPSAAVKQLTGLLEKRMRTLLIHTEDEAEDQLLHRLETLLRTDTPLPEAGHFHRIQALLENLWRWRDTDPAAFLALEQATYHYFDQLTENRLNDRVVAGRRPAAGGLLLGAPLFLYGLLNNALPTLVPYVLARRLDLYIGYHSALKVVTSLVTFPVFYWLQFKLTAYFFDAPWPWLYLLSLPLAGYFSWWYAGQARDGMRFFRLARRPALWELLRSEREFVRHQLSKLLPENTV